VECPNSNLCSIYRPMPTIIIILRLGHWPAIVVPVETLIINSGLSAFTAVFTIGSLVVTVVADDTQDVGQLGSAESSRLLVVVFCGARLLKVC